MYQNWIIKSASSSIDEQSTVFRSVSKSEFKNELKKYDISDQVNVPVY